MGTPWGELDSARLRAIAASDRPLRPHECAERARLAAALIDPGRLDRSGPGEAVLLWRDNYSEAWLNLWWRPRDTGYHDHTSSCVGVHVIEGRAWNEPLTIGEPPQARGYGPGETFWFPGEGIHRMDHQAGAVTIHVYSPPIQAIGHYDLHDGQLRRTHGLPGQPSPPSAALYEALHYPADADPASHGTTTNLCHPGRVRDHPVRLTVRDSPWLKRRARTRRYA
jgi:Cysteine dioxygenase type I